MTRRFAALLVYAPRITSRIGLALFGLIAALILIEVVLRLRFPDRPYDVLDIEPDRIVGWKHVPDFDYVWMGRACREFRAEVSINRYGFRDVDWAVEKPQGTVRIAVLGDSHVEAREVDASQTAVKLLEADLKRIGWNVEVMNFGISNYGIGQYLMVYDAYVRQFQPDYVVVYAAYFHMMRTVMRELSSGIDPFYTLYIRPGYELDVDNRLVYVPAADYDEYVAAVQKALETVYGPDRIRELYPQPESFADDPAAWLWANVYLVDQIGSILKRQLDRPAPFSSTQTALDFPYVDLNYRIIEELNDHVQADGGQLVFVDAFQFWEAAGLPGSGALTPRNQQLAQDIGAGYVNLSPRLFAASSPVRWPCDGHYNQLGNRLLADAMLEWFDTALKAS